MKLDKEMTIHLFKNYLENKGYADNTIVSYEREIRMFFSWLRDEHSIVDIREVTKVHIFEYQVYLSNSKNPDGKKKFAKSTEQGMMSTVKLLFKFLMRNDFLFSNPFDSIDLSRKIPKNNRESVSEELMSEFLDSIPLNNRVSIRDRAMFELMYGTGLRIGEVVKLDISDIDLNSGRLFVRDGKGRKDRIVPLGNNVIKHLEFYLKESRSKFLRKVLEIAPFDREAFFINRYGKRIKNAAIRAQLHYWFKKAHPDRKSISPHIIRHSFATHVLAHGIGIKEVKDILGHSSIQTTVVYTHFSIASLKRVMKMYHPRENQLYKEIPEEFKIDF